jgi:hypothetical protein
MSNYLKNVSVPEKFDLKIVQLFPASNLSEGAHNFLIFEHLITKTYELIRQG